MKQTILHFFYTYINKDIFIIFLYERRPMGPIIGITAVCAIVLTAFCICIYKDKETVKKMLDKAEKDLEQKELEERYLDYRK